MPIKGRIRTIDWFLQEVQMRTWLFDNAEGKITHWHFDGETIIHASGVRVDKIDNAGIITGKILEKEPTHCC